MSSNEPSNDIDKVAVKFDQSKPRMSLIPQLALVETARIMTYGAFKYASYNWMKGFQWTRLIDAAQRHIQAFTSGEDLDPETGFSHICHAICCLSMLFDTTKLYPENDDRSKVYKTFLEKK